MTNVVIIGAGVGGLSLAIGLKKLGIDSQIFETWPYERVEGSSYRMSRSGVYALKELGLINEVKNNSSSADYLKILTKENIEFINMNMFQSEKFEERSIFIQRSDLIEILTDKAKDLGISIDYGKKLTHFDQNEEEVTAYFEDGTAVNGSILLGADGLHSAVRKQMDGNDELRFLNCFGLYGILSSQDIPEDILPLLEKTECLYMGKGFNIMVSNSNPNREWDINWQSSGYLEEPMPSETFEQLSQDELKDWLISNYEISGSLAQLIKQTKKIIPKQIYTVSNLESLSKGRVAILGDAAHGIDPNTGSGSSVALEDAVYLASLLSKYDYSKAFYHHEHDRKERVKAIQEYAENDNLSLGMDFEEIKKKGVYMGAKFDLDYQVKLND
ncbi:FAD-dependent oxidoreductase [Alkalibacterium pelagium]|uniref:2-polyprenyl-6-methoxyphenol hydroxylase n=1 Tax=Alkalibacterium pelagium TaxID=426702 RepID=A0A1H7KHU9_9LACT|nr:FAD-dependent monooxygenase [Alkalibacterium pelagium]GEN50740.1 FAD-dependent oxidoreductase [Alkalibacterium pelagium]SEK86369.1 2-polyprenyl-6-methoxyphenol hydroxylase [Alkalibacterium pelagium]